VAIFRAFINIVFRSDFIAGCTTNCGWYMGLFQYTGVFETGTTNFLNSGDLVATTLTASAGVTL
jgi:hypothetical protein